MIFKTEVAMWRYLARRWDRAKIVYPGGSANSTVGGCWVSGLCESLYYVWGPDRDMMLARFRANMPLGANKYQYWWPLTLRGARSRAAFCRRMAKLAEAARNRLLRRRLRGLGALLKEGT